MKKLSWLLFALAFILMGLIPLLAHAQAVVIKDDDNPCQGLTLKSDNNGNTSWITVNFTDSVIVVTSSNNCNVNVTCHGILPNDYVAPAKATVLDYERTGQLCEVSLTDVNYTGSTENWHQTITPSGNVTLTCHFKDCGTPETPQ